MINKLIVWLINIYIYIYIYILTIDSMTGDSRACARGHFNFKWQLVLASAIPKCIFAPVDWYQAGEK